MFEQALLPACSLVAVADLVASRRPGRRLSVSQCGRGEGSYVPGESLNPPTAPASPAHPAQPYPDSHRDSPDSRRPETDSRHPEGDSHRPETDSIRRETDSRQPETDSHRLNPNLHRPETDSRRLEADSHRREASRPTVQYSHPARRVRNSAENLAVQSPPRALDRTHFSAPNLSSLAGRQVAAPPRRQVTLPPPPEEPVDPIYDEPRQQRVSVVTSDQLVQEVMWLRSDNARLRHSLRQRHTGGLKGRSRSEEQVGRRSAGQAGHRDGGRHPESRQHHHRRTGTPSAEAQEAAVLRQMVVRLNEQLCRCMGRPPPDPETLPLLTETRHMPALLEAYDQVASELSDQTEQLRGQLGQLRSQLQQLADENDRLHAQLADTQAQPGVSPKEWKSLSENAHLVLEENQLLTNEVQILKDKQAEITSHHQQKESQLKDRVGELERHCTELTSARDRLQDERDRLQAELAESVPRVQHERAVSECRRLFEDLRSRYTSERLTLLADTEAVQAERRRLVVQLTDAATQRAAAETQLRAANKTITRLERRVASLQGELESAEKLNSEASQHLAEVLSATDQLMAERRQLTRLSSAQQNDGDKLTEQITDEKALNIRLNEKIKAVRRECDRQLREAAAELADQARSYEARIAEYERQLTIQRHRLADQNHQTELVQTENRWITEELNILSRAATAENQKLKEQLQFVPERDSNSSGGK